MADTWPVNNGAVGTKGSANRTNQQQADEAMGRTTTSPTNQQQADQAMGRNAQGGGEGGAPTTKAGTTAAPKEDYVETRTAIQDASQSVVEITLDSFLQGLPGSLSQIIGGAVQGLLGQLDSVMSNLLSTTSLTNVFGNVVGSIQEGIGNAISGMAGALADVGQTLFTGLGNVISEIPGMGPVVRDFSSAVKGLGDTLSTAYNGLDPLPKAVIDGAIGSVGAKVLDKIGLPSIDPKTAGLVAGGISFFVNPANNMKDIATTARTMDAKVFPVTGDNVFGNLAAKSELAAKELEKVLTTNTGTNFTFNNVPVNLVNEVRQVSNQVLQDVIPAGAELFTGTIFSNQRIKNYNGKSYVVPF